MPWRALIGENGPVVNLSAVARPRWWRELLLRPSGPLPRPGRRGYAFDIALVTVTAVVAVAYLQGRVLDRGADEAVSPVRFGDWFGPVAFVTVTVSALIWRRRIPLTVLWIVTLATALLPHGMPQPAFVLCVIAGYSAAAHSPYRIPTMLSLAAAVLAVATLSPNVLQDMAAPPNGFRAQQPGVPPPAPPPEEAVSPGQFDVIPPDDDGENLVPGEFVPSLILIPIVLAASAMRVWKNRVSESRGALSRLERQRAEELRRAAEHERARIARELHDVVTHNVSVMVIQTGAARKIMDAEPEQAKTALLAVEAGGRAAMSELRHVMGLLTMDGDGSAAAESASPTADSPDLAPQPSLERLDALVSRLRDSGTGIDLTVTGAARALPSGIELAAYRVVQEALTNTVKHAVGATARVGVDYGAERLRVTVTDSGGTPGPAAATGNGRGLIGLRERLAVYGGTLRTGPTPLGGFRVEAIIPLVEQ